MNCECTGKDVEVVMSFSRYCPGMTEEKTVIAIYL
jgi:hypothetical protein